MSERDLGSELWRTEYALDQALARVAQLEGALRAWWADGDHYDNITDLEIELANMHQRVARLERALDRYLAPKTWRLADDSEVGVPEGTLIVSGVSQATPTAEPNDG